MTNQIEPKQYRSAIQALLCCRPVAYYPSLARAVGGVRAALLLSQLLYWHGVQKGEEFYKRAAELIAETGLSTEEQATARKQLIELGVITATRQGWPAIWHYQVDLDRISDLLAAVQIPGLPESGDARVLPRQTLATPESDAARVRRRKNLAKSDNRFRGSPNLTEEHIDELLTENTTETTQEEEGPRFEFLNLDRGTIQELIAFGVFASKLQDVDRAGWTPDQLRQLMAECLRDDKRGTPAALFLTRLSELKPPKPGHGYPQYNLPENPDEPTGPSIHDLVGEAIERALRPLVGDQATAIVDRIELVGIEGIDDPEPSDEESFPKSIVLACQPIIWDTYIKPNADAILTRLERLGIQAISYGGDNYGIDS